MEIVKKEWFRPKIFGWGIYPAAKEGWAWTFAWLVLVYYSVKMRIWWLFIMIFLQMTLTAKKINE